MLFTSLEISIDFLQNIFIFYKELNAKKASYKDSILTLDPQVFIYKIHMFLLFKNIRKLHSNQKSKSSTNKSK